jgi:hypothetical protein
MGHLHQTVFTLTIELNIEQRKLLEPSSQKH